VVEAAVVDRVVVDTVGMLLLILTVLIRLLGILWRVLLMRILWMILWELRLITWWLSSNGSRCDGNNVLIGWIMLLRPPMGHHTDLLFFLSRKVIPEFLCTAGRYTFSH